MDQWERGFGRFKANLGAAFVSYVSEDRNWYDLPITRAVRAWRQATAATDEATAVITAAAATEEATAAITAAAAATDEATAAITAAGPTSASGAGLELLKRFEDCHLTAYKVLSTEKYYTIGWGHYGADVYKGMTITQEQADEMLINDVKVYEGYLNTFLSKNNISVNQAQYDALLSFTYNLGNIWESSKYPTFQLKTFLINGVQNYTDEQIRDAFTGWNRSGGQELAGLTRRRNEEADMFLSDRSRPDIDEEKLREFISRLYRNFLSREPDGGGLESWTAALREGRTTGSKVVYGFVYSKEFQNNPLDNEAFVTAMYETIFGREPDAGGLYAWTGVLENGCTRKKVLAGFLNSDEMKQLCNSIGIAAGTYVSDEIVDIYTKVTYFVSRMYRCCLDRTADEGGLKAWVSGLAAGKVSGADIAEGFFFSAEMEQKNLDNAAFVTTAYVALLDREPDAAGLSAWTAALDSGNSRTKIVDGFAHSSEFAALCAEYGIL
jgi:GH24 family phage-related lysozyme (muramidase)